MALAFDSQIHQDDLGHDTLMGLQELDSHLAIFEETVAQASPSESSSDDFCDATEFAQSTQQQTPNINDSKAKAETPVTLQVGGEANWDSKYAYPTTIYWRSQKTNLVSVMKRSDTNLLPDHYGNARLILVNLFEPDSEAQEHQEPHPRQQIHRTPFRR
jgi:hypothetical protein